MQLSLFRWKVAVILCLPSTIGGNLNENSQVVANEVRELKAGFFLCKASNSTAFCLKRKQLCNTSTGKARCICEEGWKGSRCQDRVYEPPSILPTRMPTLPNIGGICTFSSNCAIAHSNCIDGKCQCQSGFTPRKESCLNINECEEGYPNGCDRNADCKDTTGAFECRCKDGFTDVNPSFPGRNCQQTNECQLGIHNCNVETQVCIDRRPPAKWECAERTPAPTPKPSPKPAPSQPDTPNPTPSPTVRSSTCEKPGGGLFTTVLTDNLCECSFPEKNLSFNLCRQVGNIYYYVMPKSSCTGTGACIN